ncbi:MAG: PepSY domain-containing protein [Oscillospiraceae bacterium]|nr:PepSY domain-containing protein [Oscillospiraceae bacterium]
MNMNTNMNTYTAEQALRIALTYAGLEPKDCRCGALRLEGGLYEIALRTDYQKLELYVDAADGEVLGFNAEPALDLAGLSETGAGDWALAA